MKPINYALVALGIVAIVAAWFGLRKSTSKIDPLTSDTLIVGTNSEYPPYSFIKNDQLAGLDIDIAREVAKRLNKKIVFKDMAFTHLIPDMQHGKIHLIAAGMTPSEERKKKIDFAQPHFTSDHFIMVSTKANPIATLEELQHKKVIVNEGYAADNYMTNWGKANLIRLITPADALLALKGGRADAFVTAYTAVKPFFDQQGQNDFVIHDIPLTSEGVALGIMPHNKEFFDCIQNTLNAMEQDGTLETLKKKWGLA